jgi:isopenicillin-N N-acyltransferase-like protein
MGRYRHQEEHQSAAVTDTLQCISVRGGPFERGTQYGALARQKILYCIDSYRATFLHRAGLEWKDALLQAARYEDAIGDFHPDALLEMRGIAEGAGVPFDAILALNCRSELMFAAMRTDAGECTSFAVLPEASESGHMLIGQNWDWIPFAREACVLLEVQRDDGPGYVTIVEAGLLAKIGFNAAGLGVCTNTLVNQRDFGRQGVPYHVMLRALLDAPSLAEAARLLKACERALSANYLIAHRSGAAVNFETSSGDARNVRAMLPDRGLLAHANHFLDPEFAPLDVYLGLGPHSLVRLDVMNRELRRGKQSIQGLQEILRSHDGAPNGICGHPGTGIHPLSARTTAVSVVADLTAGEIWVSNGPPCVHAYRRYSLRSQFDSAAVQAA